MQPPPTATWTVQRTRRDAELVDGRRIEQTVRYTDSGPVALAGSDVRVALRLDPREKGLLSYATGGQVVGASDLARAVGRTFALQAAAARC